MRYDVGESVPFLCHSFLALFVSSLLTKYRTKAEKLEGLDTVSSECLLQDCAGFGQEALLKLCLLC